MLETLVIIPAYNEESNILQVISEIKNKNLPLDILVVNDGSTDSTEKVVKTAKVKIISLPFNSGYGAALQTGFKYAAIMGYRYVIQFDGDNQHDPEDITTILRLLYEDKYDIIIGSRFIGDKAFKTGIMKKVAISVFRAIIRSTTGETVTDPSSGLQGLSRRTFHYYAEMGNFPHDFPDADILIHMIRKKYSVIEFPAHIRNRTHGVSMHTGLKPIYYFIKMLVSILVVLLRPNKPLEE